MCNKGEEDDNLEGELRKEIEGTDESDSGDEKDDLKLSGTHFAYDHPGILVRTQEQPNLLQRMSWGLRPYFCESVERADKIALGTLNAKCETIFKLASFRMPILKQRCLIYFSAFYETQHRSKKEKIKYKISLRGKRYMILAGVYDYWTNPDTGKTVKSCSIVTCEANPLMAEIHNMKKRMPVILEEDVAMKWLNPALTRPEIESLMVQYPEEKMLAVPLDPIERDLFSMDDSSIS